MEFSSVDFFYEYLSLFLSVIGISFCIRIMPSAFTYRNGRTPFSLVWANQFLLLNFGWRRRLKKKDAGLNEIRHLNQVPTYVSVYQNKTFYFNFLLRGGKEPSQVRDKRLQLDWARCLTIIKFLDPASVYDLHDIKRRNVT